MVPILVAVLVAAVSWIFFNNFTIRGLTDIAVVPKQAITQPEGAPRKTLSQTVADWVQATDAGKPAEESAGRLIGDRLPRIRIATFNVQFLDHNKARKPHVLDLLARIGREFDVLAIQEIQSNTDDILPRWVALMNASNPVYDYAIGPRVGPKGAEEQYGFIFNRNSVVIDRSELYTVDDRDDLFSFEPFVAWFRTVGPPANEAFTFSVVNIRVDPAMAEQEQQYLDDVIDAVRKDGREEDDIILAGDFQAGPETLPSVSGILDIGFAVSHVPTNVEGDATWSNLVFQKTATSEFTGQSGVWDFLRKYNLDLNRALEVSDHLPVWAEFTIVEGGEPGRVATEAAVQR
jgi:endonuclease/exonuclease/phosphatase family metal-dependent hydrolase